MKIKYSFIGSRLFSFVVVLLLSILIAHSQKNSSSPEHKKLYAEILHMDSVLFNAFNTATSTPSKRFLPAISSCTRIMTGLKITRKQ
jgi:hypothetical protein